MPTTRTSSLKAELDAQSKRTLAKLSKADPMKPIRKNLMLATQPIVPAEKAAARTLPSKDKRTRDSLRTALANAVTRKVRVSHASIAVIIGVLSKGGKANLARVVEGEIGPWQHPTYGHDPKVTQASHAWFYPTIQKMVRGVSNQIEKVLSDVEKQL